MPKVLAAEQVADLQAKLKDLLLKEDVDQVEASCHMIGDCLCVLDPSPKLPSALVIN